MVKMDVIRVSSKGQIVIPVNMRKGLREGEELVIIQDDNRFILKKVEKLTEKMKDDLEFAKRTEEAFQRIEAGQGIEMSFDNFIEEMEKW